ncbi:helix-turn-helix domain-containing protein [Kitasatospora purpeofusca]|nr:helix-turn-helix domain-containing protein [Kitasatospora purpeofusca]
MREQDELLTIGRFARLCRLSVKQLRHYDDTGLLPPTRVDPATGYRYYAADRARDALTVALLRELDVPLAVIAATLAGDGADRARLLRAERDRVAERITRDRARLELLERLADGGGLPGYEVAEDREPERRLAVVRAVTGPAGLGERVGECVGRLLAQLDGVAWRPPLWGLFPLDLGEGMRIAVGPRCRRSRPVRRRRSGRCCRAGRSGRCCRAGRSWRPCTTARTPNCRWRTTRCWRRCTSAGCGRCRRSARRTWSDRVRPRRRSG